MRTSGKIRVADTVWLVMAVSNFLPVLKEEVIVEDVKRDEESVAP